MNIQVKHNGVNITDKVISYDREHKICTGIGVLDIVLLGIYSGIEPGDKISIYENGHFKTDYFVSDIIKNLVSGTVELHCQDYSKRLVDYFISDSYTVDYPSYTRYWIEKFLTEAKVNYTFTTSSQGNLLSNMTSLGLTSAYEQITQLLQQSGWYIYFTGTGKAVIGSFQKELSPVDGTINENDILSIFVSQNDKMLRNRAVVLGAFDPLMNEYASADVSVRTRWNYDSRDKRAVVISNSNIPNKSSALAMANQILKEFARITVEKTIELSGVHEFNLGDVIRVNSRAFSGKGIITSYGIVMDRNGLVTKIVLDERCPRLFGFFDFGDYVYVSTMGSGIWRKHIRFDHTWHNFSSGLDQLAITDLHIANGLFSSVGTSGEMYYNLQDDTSWSKITLPYLKSVPPSGDIPSGNVSDGELYTYEYSGFLARATILDREYPRVLYAVDTASGLNMGDYQMMLSGILFFDYTPYLYSGFVWSGNMPVRSWVVEKDLSTGVVKDFPISISGNYNVRSFDIETDGANDYVSVIAYSGVYQETTGHDWGRTGFPLKSPMYKQIDDYPISDEYYVPNSYPNYYYVRNQSITYSGVFDGLYPFDYLLYLNATKFYYIASVIYFNEDPDNYGWLWFYYINNNVNNPLYSYIGGAVFYEAYERNPLVFDIYLLYYPTSGNKEIKKITLNLGNNTVSSVQTIYTFPTLNPGEDRVFVNSVRVGDVVYSLLVEGRLYQNVTAPGSTEVYARGEAYEKWVLMTLDLSSGAVGRKIIHEIHSPASEISPGYKTLGIHSGADSDYDSELGASVMRIRGRFSTLSIYNDGGKVKIVGFVCIEDIYAPGGFYEKIRNVECYSVFGDVESPVVAFLYGRHDENLYWRGPSVYDRPYPDIPGPADSSYTIGVRRVVKAVLPKEGAFSSGSGMNWDALLSTPSFINENGDITPAPSYYSNGNPLPIRDITLKTKYGKYGIRYNNQKFYRYHYLRAGEEEIPVPTWFYRVFGFYIYPIGNTDSIYYAECSKMTESGEEFGWLVPYDVERGEWFPALAIYIRRTIASYLPGSSDYTPFFQNLGNFVLSARQVSTWGKKNLVIPGPYIQNVQSLYAIVQKQRGEKDFKVIKTGTYPLRVEISNSAPILSVDEEKRTFATIYVMGSGGIEIIEPLPSGEDVLSGIAVADYRTVYLPDPSGYLMNMGIYIADYPLVKDWVGTLFSGVVLSGIDETNQIRTFDVNTYSGIQNTLNVGYSGFLNRIETTNYAASGQYIFVTTSGDTPNFYQKDPDSSMFVYYSGLPDKRVTMIRVDDRL
jgi:hypothetical protein